MIYQEWERVIWLWCPGPTSLTKYGSGLQERGTDLSPFLLHPPSAPVSLCLSPHLHPPPDVWTQASVSVLAKGGCGGGLHPPISLTWRGFLVKRKRRSKCQPIGEKPYQHSSDRCQVFAPVKNSAEKLSTMPLDVMMGQKDQIGVWSRGIALVQV